MLRASETLKAKSCSILRQLLKQYHPLVAHTTPLEGSFVKFQQGQQFREPASAVNDSCLSCLVYTHVA